MEPEKKPLISIIIPVYNVENYLRKCLDSVREQTYRHVEIILVDDCSVDSSGYICDEYACKDDRVQVIHLEKNFGVSHARNTGIQKAKGELLTFIDGDDYAETDMLECLYNNLVANQADVSICGIDRIGFGKYGDTWKDDFSCNVSGRQAVSCMIRRQPFTCSLEGKLFVRHMIKKYRFTEKIQCGEDLLFLYKLFQHVRLVSYIPDKLYHYVYRKDSATHRGFQRKQYTEYLVYQFIHEKLKQNSFDLLPFIEQKILDINVRLAVKVIESQNVRGRRQYKYLKKFHRNVRQYMSPKAMMLFKHKKIAAEVILLYGSAEFFLFTVMLYKGIKGFFKGCAHRRV
ncbi:MAG: glycosyltransferase family 2 protein [Hungatella sp.]|nr:glycosyltransferase family 2 protein [Hungatella sp.]